MDEEGPRLSKEKLAVMNANTKKATSVPALDRIDEIFEILASTADGASLNALCRGARIPKSTAYRLLSSLVDLGYVQLVDDRKAYVLGPKLVRLARAAFRRTDLVDIARPYLSELSHRLGETVKLSVSRGTEVEVIACVESASKLRISVTVGEHFPIYAGAASKVLLAFLPKDYRESIISSALQKFTPHTLVNPQELEDALSRIKETHVAYDNEEFIEGIRAVGCPVFDFMGEVVAAISVAYLAVQDRDADARISRERALKEVCRSLSLRLGAAIEGLPPET